MSDPVELREPSPEQCVLPHGVTLVDGWVRVERYSDNNGEWVKLVLVTKSGETWVGLTHNHAKDVANWLLSYAEELTDKQSTKETLT